MTNSENAEHERVVLTRIGLENSGRKTDSVCCTLAITSSPR